MSRVPSLSSPFLLGFDEIERVLDRVAKGADGYPPYNIERLARDGESPERLRITLAVAGFTRDQLDVSIEESQLLIRGRQQDDNTGNISTAASPRANSSAPSCWLKAWRCWAPNSKTGCCRSISPGRNRRRP